MSKGTEQAGWAAKYIDLPYADRGRDPAQGLDCWGLVRLVYLQEMGVTLPSYADEYELSDSEQAAGAVAFHKSEWTPVEQPEPGDVVLFRVRGHDAHTGVYAGGRRFLHSERGTGVVLERLNSPRWERRFVGYFRYHQA